MSILRFLKANYAYPGSWRWYALIIGLWLLAGVLTGRL